MTEQPEMTWDVAEVDAQVKKIAALSRLTTETFEDYAPVRDYIHQRMPFAMQRLACDLCGRIPKKRKLRRVRIASGAELQLCRPCRRRNRKAAKKWRACVSADVGA